jgi:tryptophanyl-tRNA synthetase
LIIQKFSKEREAFNYYMANPGELERKLELGESKARKIALDVLGRVRKKLGFR